MGITYADGSFHLRNFFLPRQQGLAVNPGVPREMGHFSVELYNAAIDTRSRGESGLGDLVDNLQRVKIAEILSRGIELLEKRASGQELNRQEREAVSEAVLTLRGIRSWLT